MSVWTHVAATIRFDAIRIPGVPSMRPILHHAVPEGSEGALEFSIWENPRPSSLAAYTATIWGDLRDFDSAEDVLAYLRRVTDGKVVRQGVAEIHVEGGERVIALWANGHWLVSGEREAYQL